MIPNLLSIAGSDPSGGAGIQADVKTFSALGCYGMAVVTALTAQNTLGVRAVHVPPADFVAAQIDAIFDDIRVDAVKIGMLATGSIAETVAVRLRHYAPRFIVLDPVLAATSGDSLGTADVIDSIRRFLYPLATLITPNAPEAARLTGLEAATDVAGLEHLAVRLYEDGARAVLVKGGHLDGDVALDVLYDGKDMRRFTAARVATRNTHGTGCTLSSAIAAYLARGLDLEAAVAAAKDYVTGALLAADQLSVGRGHGPLQHFWSAPPN